MVSDYQDFVRNDISSVMLCLLEHLVNQFWILDFGLRRQRSDVRSSASSPTAAKLSRAVERFWILDFEYSMVLPHKQLSGIYRLTPYLNNKIVCFFSMDKSSRGARFWEVVGCRRVSCRRRLRNVSPISDCRGLVSSLFFGHSNFCVVKI